MADNQKAGTGSRGFASMDEQKQREIASKGGKAAHVSGHAHEFDSEEARAAGRKGGQSRARAGDHAEQTGAQDLQPGHKSLQNS